METGQVFVRVVKLKGPPDNDKTLFHVDIPEFYTGYDESFRLPSNTFQIRCSVRARNSFDLPSEWTKGPLIKIDNRKSTSPTTSTLLDNEVKTERKRSYEAIVETKNVPRKFLNIEDLSQNELLKLLKASILENLTPKVNLEEFKKAGRRLEEIFVTRKPIDYEEEGFPRFEMDNGHESKVEMKEETFVNLNELGNAVEVISTITEKPLEKVIPTKDTQAAYFRLL
ncbi:unnamed protein product, partial [Mesorhabditis belari]|uniref:Uncharacterized protein n=1 Tax=Mesorhabditis belari TaxID=2138241 RepID=A0AAF3FLQ7_9BILA